MSSAASSNLLHIPLASVVGADYTISVLPPPLKALERIGWIEDPRFRRRVESAPSTSAQKVSDKACRRVSSANVHRERFYIGVVADVELDGKIRSLKKAPRRVREVRVRNNFLYAT